MKSRILRLVALCAALSCAGTAAGAGEFSFGVIAHPAKPEPDDARLRNAIAESDTANLAFVVVNGIKATDEECTDAVYNRKKSLLQSSKNGVVISLAASDWTECKYANGRSAAIGKLTRLRELFFIDEFSLGATRIPVTRQSLVVKFGSFAENARWEIGDIMFAAVNIPANNNHYVSDAGRNSEFEDRLIANRDWLHRVFSYAIRDRHKGIVLFCDANPLARPARRGRDGYAETRRQLTSLAAKFPGRVLIVHGQGSVRTTPAIKWRGNLGEIAAGARWTKITANIANQTVFAVADNSVTATR